MPNPRTPEKASIFRSLYEMECEIATLDAAKLKKQAEMAAKVAQVAKTYGAQTVATFGPKPAANANGTHKARKASKSGVKVLFRDPANPTENTWSGRGRPARWLAAYEAKGRKRDEFRVGA